MFERVILRAANGIFDGQEFVLDNGADYTIGRSHECTCVLEDPMCLVSRRHCRVGVYAPFVCIQDLGSRNGTWVNGTRLGPRAKKNLLDELMTPSSAEYPPEAGDIIEIAGYEFTVEFEPKEPCAAQEPRDQEKLWSCDCASI